MAAAHAYQIGSTRDELKSQFHAQRDLLARMPNLLIVSTNGAGFDTVNVKDCTDAGVLVVNQTGGNAEAVASHVLAMMLTLSKQIVQTNHALAQRHACTTAPPSSATTCTAAPSASSASAMSAAASPSSVAACSACR